ncbi:MAG: TlpA family protein disulfide reductase [Salinibacter sp.]|uniref:TlpA family protein disulfide reductase n=1 Tax=Salinibacter sp. TaxID=2065818 RepID=UPI0035D424CC
MRKLSRPLFYPTAPAFILALSVLPLLGLSAGEARAQPQPAKIGKQVPDFEIEALRDSGRAFTPSDFEGRYVLLNLWATWCGPCIRKIPKLKKARQRYSPKKLAILNVSFDGSRSKATRFLGDREMPGSHAYAGRSGLGGKFGAKFARVPNMSPSSRGLPNLTLVGPKGTVVDIIAAGDTTGLLEMLKKQLSSRQSG